MYISPDNKPTGFGRSVSPDTLYGRLIGELREAKAHEAIRIFEGRATVVGYLASIPDAHYWINLRKDDEGPYWDIQVHPDCADYLAHFESVERGLGGARYKVAIKEIK